MWKNLIIIFLFFVINFSAYSQNNINGRIINKDSKMGIPYASILYLDSDSQKSGYTDSLGFYKFKSTNDQIQISSIGYKTLILNFSSLSNNFVIGLEPVNYILNAVEIKLKEVKKTKTIRLGYFKDKVFDAPLWSLGKPSPNKTFNYVAQYVANNKKNYSLHITKLLYNLSNHPRPVLIAKGLYKGKCQSDLFRIHLFMVDEITKMPTKELLVENNIIKNDCTIDNLIIDISEQNIIMPKNGVFVGLEFIDIQRSSNNTFFPYLVMTMGKKTNDIYGSFHQEKWSDFWHTIGRPVQFGIEVSL